MILCRKGSAEKALHHLRAIMGKLQLTVNEEKTRICRVPDGEFDFRGVYVRADVLAGDGQGPAGLPTVKEEPQAHGRTSPRANRPSGYLAGDHKAGGAVEPGASRMGQLL